MRNAPCGLDLGYWRPWSSSTRLTRERSIRLAVRLGIHTGLVVVGEMGAGPIRTAGARRDTEPGGAAAGLAAPDTVVISATTYRLVQGFFACHDLGSQTLKGVRRQCWCTAFSGRAAPRAVWRRPAPG